MSFLNLFGADPPGDLPRIGRDEASEREMTRTVTHHPDGRVETTDRIVERNVKRFGISAHGNRQFEQAVGAFVRLSSNYAQQESPLATISGIRDSLLHELRQTQQPAVLMPHPGVRAKR